MKIFSALLLLLFVTACSHPLEIVGEGDIVSSTGENNCSLEEQPCINLVAGDYNVTYTAEPHAGWSFERWEGCGDQFPDCSFNVPGTTVDQHWGQVMPPLRATFSENIARKKVLIVFDDSGSMATVAQFGGARPAYDPDETYADAGFDDTKVYWSINSSKPTLGTSRYFAASSNRCESSFTPLADEGSFATKAKRWQPANGSLQTVSGFVCNGTIFGDFCVPNPPGWEIETTTEWVGDSAGWENLSTSDQTPVHIDCLADVLVAEEGNGPGQADGLPNQPTTADAPDFEAYTTSGSSNVNFGSTVYAWYTAHYLDYWYDTSIITVSKTRLEVAQDVVNELVNTNASLDFGLAVFNDNTDGAPIRWCTEPDCVTDNTDEDNGGRIIHAIIEDMTAADRAALAGTSGLINGIQAGGFTPLSESVYEAYRYLAGKTQVYGNKRDVTTGAASSGQDPRTDTPAPDPRAYVGGSGNTYKSPNSDCADSYIILLTDGFPNYDTHANAAIESFTGQTCADYPLDEFSPLMSKNCLPELTKYMANNDLDDDDSNGDQFGITYTIGFATDQQLLEDAASNGKGMYFTADTTEELAAALSTTIADILDTPPSSCE